MEMVVFKSLPFEARPIKATEAVLERIYQAAKDGLKDKSLALTAGLLPIELNRLAEFDPFVNQVIDAGRAELEREMAGTLIDAARAGDAKAALDVLKHVHKWTAPQSISVEVNQTISITQALEQAQKRVIEGIITDVVENEKPTDSRQLASLPVNQERLENEQAKYNARIAADDV